MSAARAARRRAERAAAKVTPYPQAVVQKLDSDDEPYQDGRTFRLNRCPTCGGITYRCGHPRPSDDALSR